MLLADAMIGIGRPAAWSGRGRALARGDCRAPEPRLPAFPVHRLRQDTAGLGPCGLRSHGADYADRDVARTLRPSDDAGTHHEAGPWSASRSRPPEGARGKGGSARQTHDKAAVPFQGMNRSYFSELNLNESVEIKSD